MNTNTSFSWSKTILIGLGFFTTGVSWALYNSYVPLWLNLIIPDRLIVGFIMGLDNLAMIFMEPIIGSISDRTQTRWGRRIPFLLIGVPISAFFLALLPIVKGVILILMLVIFVFILMMAFYRAPVVALMPDIVPSLHRSKANGVINLMGGLGAVYAFLFGSMLYSIDPIIAFGSTAGIMILALVLLFLFVKEPKVSITMNNNEKKIKQPVSVISSLKDVFTGSDKSCLFVLIAIFFWFVGFNAIETWFTSWATTSLPYLISMATTQTVEKAEASASFMLTAFSLIFVLFAIPAGYIGQRIGRANTIKIGLPIMLISLLSIIVIVQYNLMKLEPYLQYIIMMPLLGAAAIGWALININSIVIIWEIATDSNLGSYTGLYYLFSSSAAVFGPGIVGLIFDLFSKGNFDLLFPISIGCFLIAFFMMFGVKSGEYRTN